MMHQLLGKNIVFPLQSLGEPECLANKFNAFFDKKIEAVLVSQPPTSGLELIDSHTTTLESFHTEQIAITSSKNFEQFGTE